MIGDPEATDAENYAAIMALYEAQNRASAQGELAADDGSAHNVAGARGC